MSEEVKLPERAVLVSLTIGCWTGERPDRRALGAVETAHHTKGGKFVKSLLGEGTSLDAVHRARNKARTTHYALTAKWDDGRQILPVKGFFNYAEQMRSVLYEFDKALETFKADYPSLLSNARHVCGDLWRPEEYPAANNLDAHFYHRITYHPIPTSDFRLQLPGEELDKLRASLEADVEQRLKDGTKEVWNRLYAAVKHMADRMRTGKRLHESMLPNLIELCDTLPMLNLTDDPTLDTLAREAKEKLTAVSVDSLRESEVAREDIAAQADAILARLGGLMSA